MNKVLKGTLITLLVAGVIVGGIYGVMAGVKKASRKPVNVYEIYNMAMDGANAEGGMSESYGPVSMDQIQKVYLSSTQTVKEVLVSEGQMVKKGDPLLTYDTTLSQIGQERARIALEKKKMELEAQKQFLEKLQTATTTEKIDAAVKSIEAQIEAVYDNAPAIVYPDLPLGNWTEDDPYYMVSTGDVNVSQLLTASGLQEIWVALVDDFGGMYGNYQGLHMYRVDPAPGTTGDPEFYVSFFTPEELPYTGGEPDEELLDTLNQQLEGLYKLYESAYPQSQLGEMKKETAEQINSLELEIRISEVELAKAEAEIDDGTVKATIDGVVKSVLPVEMMGTVEEAALVVSGGGSYYVTGSIGEFSLDEMHIGDMVTINSWNNGMMYEGEIIEIGTEPTTEINGYVDGNNNISWYPFKVRVGEDAELQEFEYVSITYSSSAEDSSIYLEKPYIRSDDQGNYVFVEGADGKLEKRYVKTGRELWGYYLQILDDGLTMEDHIAFPYGTDVVEGAEVVEAPIDELWNMY